MRQWFLVLATGLVIGAPLLRAEGGQSGPQPADEAPSRSSSAEEGSVLNQLTSKVLTFLWAADNLYTTYGDYPYASDTFIQWPEWRNTKLGYVPVPQPGRNSWYTAEAQVFSLPDLGTGLWFAFQGHLYRFSGPLVEAWTITDGASVLNGARVGLEFSLVQADPFSLSIYGQVQGWAGSSHRLGAIVGFLVRTFPLKPFTAQARLGVQDFGAFQVAEAEVQGGLFVGETELVAGWRSWGLGAGAGKGRDVQGPFLGLRHWL